MKGVIAGVIGLCLVLVVVGISLASHDGGSGRILAIDQQYAQRVADGYWKRGATNPATTLEVYSDFECSACVTEYPIIETALQQLGTTVQFRFRQRPVGSSAASVLAAKASEAAGRQGKFWLMYQKLYATQPTWVNQDQQSILATFLADAKDLGLNTDQYKRDFDDSSLNDQIDADITAGNALKVASIPSFFLNGQLISPPHSLAELTAALQASNQTQ